MSTTSTSTNDWRWLTTTFSGEDPADEYAAKVLAAMTLEQLVEAPTVDRG